MPGGKLPSQISHAVIGALKAGLGDRAWRADCLSYIDENPGTKVVLEADLGALNGLVEALEIAGIPHFVVVDEGHVLAPDFTGEPIVTALGIAPLRRGLSSKYLRKLRLLR